MPTTIDCNCMVGPATVPASGSEFSVDLLKKGLDLAGLDRAMVYHSWAKEHDPKIGNQKLMKLVAEEPRLMPVWVLLPHDTGEMEAAEDLVQSMIRNGVHMARLFPKDHNFSLSEWGCGDLLSALEQRRIPLMVDLSQSDYDSMAAVLSAHPDLPLILSDVAYRSDRFIYPLLAAHPNLRIETSRYQTHRGIESICDRFGSSRLVFGSRSPDLPPGPMAMTIRYASIGRDDRERILGGNIQSLMEGIRR